MIDKNKPLEYLNGSSIFEARILGVNAQNRAVIEFRIKGSVHSGEWQTVVNGTFDMETGTYHTGNEMKAAISYVLIRNIVEKQLVPFTFEDLKDTNWHSWQLRSKATDARWMIGGISKKRIYSEGASYEFSSVLREFEYRISPNDPWKPFGKEVEAKHVY